MGQKVRNFSYVLIKIPRVRDFLYVWSAVTGLFVKMEFRIRQKTGLFGFGHKGTRLLGLWVKSLVLYVAKAKSVVKRKSPVPFVRNLISLVPWGRWQKLPYL